MNWPYLVFVEHVHTYQADETHRFQTQASRDEFAQKLVAKSGKWGSEDYTRVSVGVLTEELN